MRAEFLGLIMALTLCVACAEEAGTYPTPVTSTVTSRAFPATPTFAPTVTPIPPSPKPNPATISTATTLPTALEKLVPSLVKIRIGDWEPGTGFVVEEGYVVTAAHVVWPQTSVDVVFDDGSQYTDVPVVSYDYLADLAFLGPISISAPHVDFANVEDVSEGDTVFVVGYPTTELSVAKGEFEHTYSWTDTDVTDVRSTAYVPDGMSGGPMTNDSGEVIGVLSWGYDHGGSGGASSNVVQERLDKIRRGEKASPAGSRFLPTDKGGYEHEFALLGRLDTKTFVIRDLYETSISMEFDATRDVEYGLFDEDGYAGFTPAFRSTRNALDNSCCYEGMWFVVVRQRFDLESEVVLKSSVPLVPYHDPDDGKQLRIGDTVVAVFDTPSDVDRYTVDLAVGRRVGIRFESNYSVRMEIDHPDPLPCEIFSVEGVVEEIEYQAVVDGEYTISIKSDSWPDGYTLSIFDTGTKPADMIESPVGDMLRHTFERSPPTVQIAYPVNITGGDDAEVLGAAVFKQGCRGETVALEERDTTFLKRSAQEELSLDKYVRRSVLFNDLPLLSNRVTARREIVTPFGASVLIEDFEANGGDTKGVRLTYIHEGNTGFMAVFYAPTEVFGEWRPVVDYCIGTFSIGEFSVAGEVSGQFGY